MKKIAAPSEDTSNVNKENLLFFNQIFDKKRLKALISWVFKQSGEAEALRVIDLLKETGFRHATKAGISIGLHDLVTPIQKAVLISESQLGIATTDRDFSGAKITATERSQRIIDTWHRASESLSKQVVDYFAIYDRFNPVYIMALSGARGNFSQVRQLIGMRGLMADQQGKIVNFPIQSNLREGLTLTEYFISCSGARKGLVDTALRTADTGYLTRRLVDVSHHVVVKKLRCNTNRSLAFRSLQSYNKVLLPLKERLIGRVLSEDIFISEEELPQKNKTWPLVQIEDLHRLSTSTSTNLRFALRSKVSFLEGDHSEVRSNDLGETFTNRKSVPDAKSPYKYKSSYHTYSEGSSGFATKNRIIAKQDQEISLKLALKIAKVREKVYLRSPLTCGFTHSVCQLCYGWSISQGSLVSLGDAVGVIAAQSIGEPGTQLTMRTFHTGGVFSGDLLQEIRAPHAGKIAFSKAFGGLLIRTAHGHLAFLSKSEGSLYISNDEPDSKKLNIRKTVISIPAFSLLFIRHGEKVRNNQLLAEFSIRTKEGAQPIKTQQTIFAELSGIIVEDCSGRVYTKRIKESALLIDSQNSLSQSSCFNFQESNSFDSRAGRDHQGSEGRFFASSSPEVPPSKNVPGGDQIEDLYDHSEIHALLPKVDGQEAKSILAGSKSRVRARETEKEKLFRTKSIKSSICKAQTNTNFDIENDLFSYVEPVQSGRLGFLKILSTRIGATLDYSYPIKSIDSPFVKKNKIHHLKKDRYDTNLDHLNLKSLSLRFLQIENKYLAEKGLITNTLTEYLKPYFNFHPLYGKLSQSGGSPFAFYKTAYYGKSKEKQLLQGSPLLKQSFQGSKEPSILNSLSFLFLLGIAFGQTKGQDKPLLVEKKQDQNLENSLPKNKIARFCFSKAESKYLHPNCIKENRFFLQTIAEYGDIVDETYKKRNERFFSNF